MKLNYGDGEKTLAKENIIMFSDEKLSEIEYLLFVDSRGLVNNHNTIEYSFIYLLKKELDLKKISYLIMSRPKNLTIFSTISNFIKLNPNLNFKYLITNLGLVDCTPKKQDNIEDILLQLKQFSNIDYSIVEHEKYLLSNGQIESLRSIEYTKEYLIELNTFLNKKFEQCYFLNTPIVLDNIEMDRERPKSFFTQLNKTNKLVDSIVGLNKQKNILIDIQDLNATYDGVHYTEEGHQLVFNRLKEGIAL